MEQPKLCSMITIYAICVILIVNMEVVYNQNSDYNWLRPSLFPNVPPYLRFAEYNSTNIQIIDPEIKRYLNWPANTCRTHREIINSIVNASGYQILETSDNLSGKWIGSWTAHGVRNIKANQKHNFVPSIRQNLGDKDKQWLQLKEFLQQNPKYSNSNSTSKLYKLVFPAFVLPKEMNEFKSAWKEIPNKLWIVKSPKGSGSTNVKVISEWTKAMTSLKKNPTVVLVQKYLHDTLLVNGRKPELRIYLLITSVYPLRAYVSYRGAIKLTAVYTNASVANPDNIPTPCEAIYYHPKCRRVTIDRTARRGNVLQILHEVAPEINVQQVEQKIDELLILSLLAAQHSLVKSSLNHLKNSYNSFNILAVDFFLDKQGQPWLNEFNTFPRRSFMRTPKTISEMFNIVGYHITNDMLPPSTELKLSRALNLSRITFSEELYKFPPLANEKMSQILSNFHAGKSKLVNKQILEDLSSDEIRQLIIAEDELARVKETDFKRLLPGKLMETLNKYLPTDFDEVNQANLYYNLLFNAWEEKYSENREEGIKLLDKFTRNK